MSDTQRDQLENELAKMTTYTGAETSLWRDALDATRTQTEGRNVLHTLTWHRPLALAAVVALLITAAIVTVMLTAPRASVRYAASLEAPTVINDADSVPQRAFQFAEEQAAGSGFGGGEHGRHNIVPEEMAVPGARVDLAPQRMVIRRATIELAAGDVRGTYLRIMQIPSRARGEYIDDSSLTGNEPEKLHGSITLRIAADRLPDVLNEVRELGRVVSEQSKADDVTGQVVDLEARLRNERRIEQELLELLSKRVDAPLRDVLELRRHLEQVRGQIERLAAQRDQVSRLVSLATVLVIIRYDQPAPEPEEEGEVEPGLGAYFLENLSGSAVAGLRVLADTIAGFVHLAIGGLVWWMIAFACILVARSLWLRSAPLPT